MLFNEDREVSVVSGERSPPSINAFTKKSVPRTLMTAGLRSIRQGRETVYAIDLGVICAQTSRRKRSL